MTETTQRRCQVEGCERHPAAGWARCADHTNAWLDRLFQEPHLMWRFEDDERANWTPRGNYPLDVGTDRSYAALHPHASGVPRVRAVGDPPMPLNDEYPETVVFVIGLRTNDESGLTERVPIGTAFFVSVPSKIPNATYRYVVTARHVVACEPETWLRMKRRDGSGWTDAKVAEWRRSSTADVAVVSVAGAVGDQYIIRSVPLDMFADRLSVRPALGDPVYFIGLLSASDLASANVPVVRSGTLAAMYQSAIGMKDCDDTIFRQEAHIIDCRSYNGFSGSPCFAEFRIPVAESKHGSGDIRLGDRGLMPEIFLVGLISGHWDQQGRAHTPSGEQVRFPINTGVAMATPVERVRELLMDDDFVREREQVDRQEEERKAREERDSAAVADRVGDGSPMTRADFETALRKVSRRKPLPPDEGTSGT